MILVLNHCLLFDGVNENYLENASVVIENDRIKEITTAPVALANAQTIDCGGRVVMPGLIDAHMHAYTPTYNFYENDRMPAALMASHAAAILEGMLQRGFTSVRDAAGGDRGLWLAIEQGLIKGPRFYFAGKAMSQTGGHGDMRPRDMVEPCGCGVYSGLLSTIVDGADEMRKAVRDELHRGAHHIKLCISGGVVSPTDPMWMNQFNEEEIRVAVYEAATRRSYVMAHCHTEEAIRRCVEYGVRTIEHGSEISKDLAQLMAEKNVYLVPTLSTVDVIRENYEHLNLPESSADKVKGLFEKMLVSIENCTQAGVKIGLGADLLGHDYHPLQGGELALRGEVNTSIEVLRSATSINAEILQMSDELGCIKPGAYADMLVLNGDPMQDLSLFKQAEKNIPLVMKGGQLVRNYL